MGDDTTEPLTIIGIGSSAGGLEAIRELVATLPADLAVTYIVVQHMSPHHKSLMTELVGRQTELQVRDVEDNVRPQANVVYITPPKTDVILEKGMLRLKPPSDLPAAPKPSVDRFLKSLADDQGAKSMAVILSGTGTDGAYGVQAIREAGGITIAQDSASAKYDGMPQSAVQTGCVDLVLRPLEIGTHLRKIITSSRSFSEFRRDELQEGPVTDLLQILLARTRVDFRDYKQTTVSRRIARRMTALGIDDQVEYAQLLRNTPSAVDELFKDLLISVTRFFRDPEEFEYLRVMFEKVIKDRPEGPLRIWIAGCATGEEAYSIAMMIAEVMGGPDIDLKERVQIFATDIDKNALKIARAGKYPSAALSDIPKDLAAKYLSSYGDGFRVNDQLRTAILFSDHNVCQDPPFQNVHLVCCRNLLIYFGNSLQKKVMSRFHYSMTADALLFLGTAENVTGSEDLFTEDRLNSHVFRKRALSKRARVNYTMPAVPSYAMRETPLSDAPKAVSTGRQLFEALINSLGPNSILVSEDSTIVQVRGTISPFIEVNQASKLRMHLDLLKSPLREEARSLVSVSLRNKTQRSGIRHTAATPGEVDIRLDVFPIIAPTINERVAVVVFTELPHQPSLQHDPTLTEGISEDASDRIIDLEREVAITREALQQTIEQLEISNEELQSLNEELQSTNEELQATNEELETSNEELQSTNEELITVNEELQITATELSGKTGELTSVLKSTPLAILVTDSALQISQATQSASELFNLKQPFALPHISQITLPDGYPALAPICNEALRLGATTQREFSSDGGRVGMSCSPYFDSNGRIMGLTLVVTQFPGLAREMEMILNTTQVNVMNRDAKGKILRISQNSARMFGLTREDALGRNMYEMLREDQVETIKEQDRRVLQGEPVPIEELITMGPDSDNKMHVLAIERNPYFHPEINEMTIYNVATDVTRVIDAMDQTQTMMDRFRHLQELAGMGYWELDPISREVYWSPKVFEIHGVDEEDGAPHYDDALAFYHPDEIEDISRQVGDVTKPGAEFEFEARLIQKGGTEIKIRSHGISITDSKGTVTKIIGAFAKL